MRIHVFSILLLLSVQYANTQVDLEIEGKTEISAIDEAIDADSIVVLLADGTLARRDPSSLTQFQILSISNDTIYLTGGEFVKLTEDNNVEWMMMDHPISTQKYISSQGIIAPFYFNHILL